MALKLMMSLKLYKIQKEFEQNIIIMTYQNKIVSYGGKILLKKYNKVLAMVLYVSIGHGR